MVKNDREPDITQERIRIFEQQALQIRRSETNADNYRLSVAGFLAEIDRMNLDIREYRSSVPGELPA